VRFSNGINGGNSNLIFFYNFFAKNSVAISNYVRYSQCAHTSIYDVVAMFAIWTLARKMTSFCFLCIRVRVESYAAFTLNGFDDQERKLTFVKTAFQVLKPKFLACSMK